jgi:two-component system chemotaxis sensor kinase CheA
MVEQDFLSTFLDEAVETLAAWEQICLSLESNPDDSQVNALFRAAHNLKGSSRSVGLESFGQFVHVIEDTITEVKKDLQILTPAVLSVFLECQSLLTEWVEAIKSDPGAYLDYSVLQTKLNTIAQKSQQSVVKADQGFGFFEDETAPNPKPASQNLGDILIEKAHVTQDQVDSAVKVQNAKLGQILVAQGATTKQAVREALVIQKQQGGGASDESIRVSLRKLDNMIRLIGELSIQHSIVASALEPNQVPNQKAAEAVVLTSKVIQDLQNESMNLRMQPVEGLFRRLERVARDVARAQNKQISVVLKGYDVEMDKTVLEQMKDPLVHIIRNAVDHGLETSEARSTSGKPLVANVTISATQTAQNVVITIADDGRGLAKEKILKKALEKGLIPEGRKLKDDEIHQLIFMPGFSTAEKITDVSGRGVGMDVVRSSVAALQGRIDIQSVEGSGTTFMISLPSTLSVLEAIIVSDDDAIYAVPIQDVREVVDLTNAHIEHSGPQSQMMNLRGRVIPIEPMAHYLPQKAPLRSAELSTLPSRHTLALVTSDDQSHLALSFDRVVGRQSIVVRPVDSGLDKIPGFSGATILASGDPAMIIHLPHFLKSFQKRAV